MVDIYWFAPSSYQRRDTLGHQIRVFGDGCYEGPAGKYPSLRVCDEIDPNTKIQVNRKNDTTVTLWSAVHDLYNPNWTRTYSKFADAGRT